MFFELLAARSEPRPPPAICASRRSHPPAFASRQKQRNPSRRFMFVADGEQCDDNGHTNEGARDSPKEAPKKYREKYNKRRNRQSGAGYSGLEIASDDKLDQVQTYENNDGKLPGLKLNKGE